jgi:hypothetical protein
MLLVPGALSIPAQISVSASKASNALYDSLVPRFHDGRVQRVSDDAKMGVGAALAAARSINRFLLPFCGRSKSARGGYLGNDGVSRRYHRICGAETALCLGSNPRISHYRSDLFSIHGHDIGDCC